MNDIVNVRMLVENLVESCLIGDVQLIEGRPLSADELDAVHDLFRRIVQIINNDDLVIGLEKSESGEGANVARTTAKVSLSCTSIPDTPDNRRALPGDKY